jgi:hypothetical protein
MGQALIGAALNIYVDAWQVAEPRKNKGSFLRFFEQIVLPTLLFIKY